MAEFGSFEEFWAALNRLYTSIVALQERQDKTDQQLGRLTDRMDQSAEHMDQLTERLDRTVSMVATLAGTVTQLTQTAEAHERRLERLEGQ